MTTDKGLQVFLPTGRVLNPKVPVGDGYSRELDYFLTCIERKRTVETITPASSAQSVRVVECEIESVRKRLLKADIPELLGVLRDRLAALEVFDAASTEAALRAIGDERGLPASKLVHPLRIAVSGLSAGPGLFEMLETLGKERVLRRIDRAQRMIAERQSELVADDHG